MSGSKRSYQQRLATYVVDVVCLVTGTMAYCKQIRFERSEEGQIILHFPEMNLLA